MKIFLTFIFVAAIATLGVMNGNVQAADEQKAEAVASTVEHPKWSILRLSTQNQKKRLSNLSNSIVISKMLHSRGVLFATVNLPKARQYAPTFFINYLNAANE